ncbi:MAG TPA: phosphonate ABC transporter, permease protein PhnE [Roseomonas sp.]|jgi:phosphonate transport system permease protein
MSASSALRQAARDQLPALREAHPHHFRRLSRGQMMAVVGVVGAVALLVWAVIRLDLTPARFLTGLQQLWHFITLMVPPDPGNATHLILNGLLETLAIAFLGTLLAACLAFPIGLLAAHNTTVNGIVRFASRRMLDGIRGVDTLIWALIWVGVVGLGPFAGVLAIMTSDFGTFGKMFSEAIESADGKAQEGVVASGGAPWHRIRFGVLPQVLPVIAGQVLYLFESNVRSSAIIGIVGAGGIGLHLSEMIRTLEWQAVSFIVLLILVLVAVIDFFSSRLRAAIAGTRA